MRKWFNNKVCVDTDGYYLRKDYYLDQILNIYFTYC